MTGDLHRDTLRNDLATPACDERSRPFVVPTSWRLAALRVRIEANAAALRRFQEGGRP